ncbi:cell division protein SepF [Gloeothece citriformis]|uniref:cell division protein SepF n=1 Tax=Gloeothece citriformis TaxID=2546356 RepID=UPI000173C631|nr:cell division protein SepF [Gloeothece citriformis]
MVGKNSELIIFELSHLEEVLPVMETLRDRQTVIVNLEKLNPSKIQRVIDWISGCTQAIDGQVIWLGELSFMFAPSTVKVKVEDSKKSSIAPLVQVS